MKSSVLKTVSGFSIFSLIFLLALAMIRPVYRNVSEAIEFYEDTLISRAEEITGLGFSYESLSPSILSRLYLKNVRVTDKSTGEELLLVKRISVGYRISKIIKRDWNNAFTRLSADTLEFNFNPEILSRLAKLKSEGEEKRTMTFDEVITIVNRVAFVLPFDMHVRNLKCRLNHKEKGMELLVTECKASRNSGKSAIGLFAGGVFAVSPDSSGHASFGARYRLEGTLLENVNESSFKVRLDDYSRATCSVRRMEYLLNYSDKNLELRSTQHFYPYSVYTKLDTESFGLDVHAEMNGFDPFLAVRLPERKRIVSFIKGAKVTTNTDARINILDRKLSWTSVTSAVLDDRTEFPGGQKLEFRASGTEKLIKVPRLVARGDFADLNFSGSFDISRMQPSGTLEVTKFNYVPNGNHISADLFFDPVKNGGFLCFIPELRLGEQIYNAVQIFAKFSGNSFEAEFEATDFSHPEYDTPGKIKASTTIQLGNAPYLEASASLENVFLDTGLSTGRFFSYGRGQKAVSKLVEPAKTFITTLDVYFSTNFKTFSYNSPAILIANTARDRQVLFMAADGNESSVRASRFDLIYGKNSLNASIDLDYSLKGGGALFSSALSFNMVPYSLSGSYTKDSWLTVSGDYGLNVQVNLADNPFGSAVFSDLPVRAGDFNVGLSLDSVFSSDNGGKWNAAIKNLEVTGISSRFSSAPRIVMQGEMNEKSFVMSQISYTDKSSVLEGYGYTFWNFTDGILDNMTVNLNLENTPSNEKISFQADMTNPMHGALTLENLRSNCFFNIQSEIRGLPMSRFFVGQTDDDAISATLNASGTLDNPYLSVNLSQAELLIGGSVLKASCQADYMEKVLTVSDASVSWNFISFNGISSRIDMSSFEGDAGAEFSARIGGKYITAKCGAQLSNLSVPGQSMPDSFSVELNCTEVDSNFVRNFKPVMVSFIRTPGRTDIVTDEILGAYGEILDDGSVSFSVQDSKPLHFNLAGTMVDQKIDFSVDNFFCNLGWLLVGFNSPVFAMYKGELSGALTFNGEITAPEMGGFLTIKGIDFNIPSFVSDHFTAPVVNISVEQEEISVEDTVFKIKNESLTASANIILDRWLISSIQAKIATKKGAYIPVKASLFSYSLDGLVGVDADILFENGVADISGKLDFCNTDISLLLFGSKGNIFQQEKKNVDLSGSLLQNYVINMDMEFGNRVHIGVEPVMRALISPNTHLAFSLDTESDLWALKGDVLIRGGEISYLNRNFYLKEGRLSLDENQNTFDPVITVRAEAREHDSFGAPVLISLSANRQRMSSFNGTLSSVPAKSEKEIMEILGNIVAGDATTGSNLLVSGLDYGVQLAVVRKIEKALRDLLNFDIFSVRTAVIQNSIMQGFNMKNNQNNRSSFSNLFDNTTVYIGKHFGSDIYVDAMLHLSYDESRKYTFSSVDGLVFKPEIGFELEAPFATIRYGFAPDFANFQKSFSKANSITLSWRLTF